MDSLSTLLLCAVTAADERVDDAWRREPAAAAPELTDRDPRPASVEHRIGLAVRRWRRELEEYAEDEVSVHDRSVVPDSEVVTALVATALLGARRARSA
ncbi:ATP-binding protein, partial [Streptomyces sp. T21Q-yed]|nr:ATP-binding protein [Streptomyces sp. T21Q-yed]